MRKPKPRKCNHKDHLGNFTVEIEDDTCSTDLGDYGGKTAYCTKCGENITDVVDYE